MDDVYNGTYVHDEFPESSYTTKYDSKPPPRPRCDRQCVFVLASNIIIFILGIVGNGLVIWVVGVKTKRSVTSIWYLSLAVSDFLFCTTLPFNGIYMATGSWYFGHFMCKFLSATVPLNLYSSIFLLLVISADRCMCVVLPVWTQNHRTLKKSSAVIILVWLLSALLALPYLLFKTTVTAEDKINCIYPHDSGFSPKIAVFTGFVFGFAIPLIVIVICYSVIMLKLRANRKMRSSKPFKVMSAVILTFVVCWLPYQIFCLLEVHRVLNSPTQKTLLKTGIQISDILAYANSFINPILYSFMGQDFRKKCLVSILSRMENALQEDVPSTSMAKTQVSFIKSKVGIEKRHTVSIFAQINMERIEN